jgi:two-component system response regulator HydG
MESTNSRKTNILIVEDEEAFAETVCDALQAVGHRCTLAHNLPQALEAMGSRTFDVILTDLMMDGRPDGMEVLRKSRKLRPPPPVILLTAINDVPTSKQAVTEGAYDYITKPPDMEDLRNQVNRAVEKAELQRRNLELEEQLEQQPGFEGIIGKSQAMLHVLQTARQVAASDIPVLITGESGTGKELVARAIHQGSRRRRNRMVSLNCAGLSESILEDELFGHVKGAFTGANSDREGRFEHADGGTLFMDEIGDMPQAMQAKLLRVLENGEVVRVGSNEPRQVDVRLISATNRNLEEMVQEKKFREDLYFRIKGIVLALPPLRERREDIPLLTWYFVTQAAEKYGKTIDRVSPEAQQLLNSYGWRGNVRELRRVVENMVVLSSGPVLGPESLPPEIKPSGGAVGGVTNLAGLTMEQVEREHILQTLKMTEGNREQAAALLGMGERTLYRKIKEYGL